MKTTIISYLSTLISLAVLDFAWLSIMVKKFYGPRLAHLTAETTSYVPAILFYLLYAIGISILIVLPALEGNFSFIKVFLLGALLGLCAYGAYDFTNQATLRDWPTVITIVDLLWGAFLTGVASVVAVYVVKLFN